MRGAKSAKMVASAIVVALAATACGGGGGESGDSGSTQVSMDIGEPQNGLVPSNTYESEGGEVVAALFTGLVNYDAEGNSQLDMAESIESEDQVHWTIKIKDGYTFHNGEKVTAKSYAQAWSYGAHQENTQETNPLFSKIEGYDELNPGPEKEVKADKLSGLEVVDDLTLKVTLNTPFSAFKSMLGFNGFMPLPDAFFDDPEAFGDKPIGNGLFKIDGKWQHNEQIKTTAYKKHPDADKIDISGVTFKIYQDPNTAWKDLQANNLDIMDDLPSSSFGNAKATLGDRYIEGKSSGVGFIGFPVSQTDDYDDMKIRQAVSMSIDRAAINKAIFAGSRPPADDFISPVVPGYRKGACEFCKYDPKEAKKLYEESEGLPNDTMEIGYNADGGHKDWITAAARQIEKALGVKVKVKPFEQFAAILDQLGDQKYTGAYRLGWLMDYPNMENYLRPLYSEIAIENGSNYSGYINEDFEKLLDEADGAPTEEKAIELYQKADDILLKEMPVAPVYFYQRNAGFSDNLSAVTITADDEVDWTSVKPS
jgi:oligopeptide transport system substrate-binding protein